MASAKDLLRFIMSGANYFDKPRVGGGRAKDPALYSPFSMTKHRNAPSNYEVEGSLLGNLDRPTTVTPSQIQGKTLYFATGDRTSNDRLIERINDYLLPDPKQTYGGPEYMDQRNRGSWASEPTAMRAKQKALNDAGLLGEDALLAYMPMGERSGDFSKHMSEVYGEMIKASPMGGNSFGMIDDAIAARFPKLKNVPSYKNREQFADWLSNLKGGQRASLIKFFDSSQMQELGLPDVGAARFAVTNPDLVKSEALSVGYRMSSPDLLSEMVKSKDHPSYGAFMPRQEGTGSLTLSSELPFIIGARDTALPKAAAGKLQPLPKDIKSYMGNPRLRQLVDQQFVDEAGTYEDLLRTQGPEAAARFTQSLLDAYISRN